MSEVYNNEDVKRLQEFAQFISDRASFDRMSTKDIILYVKLMQGFNGIVTRMANDLVPIQYPEEKQEVPGQQPAPKKPAGKKK